MSDWKELGREIDKCLLLMIPHTALLDQHSGTRRHFRQNLDMAIVETN